MNIIEVITEEVGTTLQEECEIVLFNRKLADLVDEFQNASPQMQERLISSMVPFTSTCLARIAMWHVEDHEGTECAQGSIKKAALLFAEIAIERCKEIAKEDGLTDPFEVSGVNADLVREMLAKKDS